MNMIFSKTKWKIHNSVKLPKNDIAETNNKHTQPLPIFQKGMFGRIQITSQCMNCKIYK